MKPTPFNQLLLNSTEKFTPVINHKFLKSDYFPIDLSSANKSLKKIDLTSSTAMENYINAYLKKNDRKVAFGGYLEKRAIYERSTHFNKADPSTQRNIHLGVDLWVDADTEVLTVLDGEVHSFQDNTNFGDYGPTILIKHKIETKEFYTLYGHLSRASLVDLKIGQFFKKGSVIGHLGKANENGDYAPHLHFQVIKDISNFKGDYPGVCAQKDLELYAENCPDPNLLLKIL